MAQLFILGQMEDIESILLLEDDNISGPPPIIKPFIMEMKTVNFNNASISEFECYNWRYFQWNEERMWPRVDGDSENWHSNRIFISTDFSLT